jgi:hypothetical protein
VKNESGKQEQMKKSGENLRAGKSGKMNFLGSKS